MLPLNIDTTAAASTTWAKKSITRRPDTKLLKLTVATRDQTHSPDSCSSSELSPYPQSSSSSTDDDLVSSDSSDFDSDPESTPTTASATVGVPASGDLRTTLARCPEPRLRALVTRLVDHSPGVQHALAQELLFVAPRPAPIPKVRLPPRKRRPRGATITPANVRAPLASDSDEEKERRPYPPPRSAAPRTELYHPGRLEEDEFEFPWWCSRPLSPRTITTLDSSLEREQEVREQEWLPRCTSVIRTIRMWNCCDGDADSVGCCSRSTAPHRNPEKF